MIIKVAGVNGSGKTSLARAFMENWTGWDPIPLVAGKPKYGQYVHALARHEDLADIFDEVVVLGDYRNVCGGMDTISDKEQRLALVAQYASRPYGHRKSLVFYEGLITGKTWGAMGALALDTVDNMPWLFVFMDTPFDVCVDRVLGRRKEKGNDAPFDPERTMRPTYKSCLRVEEVAEQHRFPTHDAHFRHSPAKQVMELRTAISSTYKAWAKEHRF